MSLLRKHGASGKKPDSDVQIQFKKKLKERLIDPIVVKDSLRTKKYRYRIKLLRMCVRLVYQVRESDVVVKVIAVDK